MDLHKVLLERGLLDQITSEELPKKLQEESFTIYCGFDPTADSLHLGNFVPILALVHAQRLGHQPICVVGGATAMIGDPSGKSQERNLLTEAQIEKNLNGVKNVLSRFIRFEGEAAAFMLNNHDWMSKFSYLDFLRDVGKHFTVNNMVAKESVKKRMENPTSGLSFTEFSYQLLQAYDFYHLYKSHNCRLQIGGSDQWGNITAGTDLVRKKAAAEVYGLTLPLLTTSSGEKFGKTAGNAVWMDAEKTPTWDFYQFWIQTSDDDCSRFLKIFTFIPVPEIDELMSQHSKEPHKRMAQKRLAAEVTAFVHGKEEADRNAEAAENLFSGQITKLPVELIKSVLKSSNSATVNLSEQQQLLNLFVQTNLLPSMSQTRRKLNEGALYLNDERLSEDRVLTKADILKDGILLIRMGKKNYGLVQVAD